MKRFTQFMLVIAALLVAQIAIIGQTTTGRLVGTVSEANGGVVPGATVVVVDTKTNRELTSTTNGEGGFAFAALDQGTYSVKVTAKGFKTTITTIKIETGQEYSLPVGLQIGEVTESVTVTAGADIINSTNAELNSTISNRQITELPLANRNPLSLILTQAGSASSPNQNTSINGGRTSSTNITRDGVNINDNFIRQNATDFSSSRVSVDNVEEFTLSSQSSVDAGFGSAQVAFSTPRGGNQFHGAAWEYNRNSAVAANSFFNNASGNYGPNDALVLNGQKVAGQEKNPRPFRNRNQYGAKVSGPIIKNKLFFFGFAERLKDLVFTNRLTTVLTQSARQGIFKYQVGSSVFQTSIFCPGCFTPGTSGTPVPTAINPGITAAFLTNMPVGNTIEAGDQLNTTGYRFSQQAFTDRDAMTGRLDYDLNSANNINFVVDYNFESNLRSDLGGTSITPQVTQPARNVIYSGGWRWSPTATISNEFRGGQLYSAPEFLLTVPIPAEYYTAPLINQPYAVNGTPPFRNQGRFVTTRNFQDTLSWQRGNHGFRFGAQYQSVGLKVYNDAGISPVYTLGLTSTFGPTLQAATLAAAAGGSALSTAQQTSARNLLALLGGVISGGSQTFNAQTQTSGFVSGITNFVPFNFSLMAPYALDQWKVTPELTLNVGIRYDYQTPLEAENGLYFEPTIANGRNPVDAVLDPAGTVQFVGGNAGRANAFYKPDKNNWAPSFGLAWAPREIKNGFLHMLTGENFVVRGGYRRSYVNDETVTAPRNALANLPGFSTSIAATGTNGTGIDDRVGATHTSSLVTPAFLTTRTYTTNNTASFSNTGSVFAVDPNLQTPNQNDYQIGIQRQFGKWVTELRYVGGYSKNMLRTIDYNQIKLPQAYINDFAIVRQNVLAGCATTAACAAGTTMFIQMGNNGNVVSGANFGLLNTNANLVLNGMIAELAWTQLIAGGANGIPNPNTPTVPTTGANALRAQFLPNPNAGTANVLLNGGHYNYNAMQLELRRRFSDGLYLQANYTFSKELTDAVGTGQTRVEPYLDNNNRGLDYTRADYDQTHVINVNAIYELPFGKGHRWVNSNNWLDYAIGGWQVGLIWRVGSGSPVTFTDARGTLNRSGRSGRQTALTSLSDKQLKALLGVFKTPCGIYYINPRVLNINQNALAAGQCGTSLNTNLYANPYPGSSGTVTASFNNAGGVGAGGYGSPVFPGQVFFNNGPLQTSGLRRAIVNGPWYSSADLSLSKNFRITEKVQFQIRGEAYNFLNTPYFNPGQFLDINSTSFGKVSSVSVGARVIQFAGRLSF